jgi:general secretion pathway protein G
MLLGTALAIVGCLFIAMTTGVIGHPAAPRRDRALLDLGNLEGASRIFRKKHGRLPTSIDELVAARILEKPPLDPWGAPYRYCAVGDAGVFVSLGADKAPGGADAAEDLVSKSAPAAWSACEAVDR